jgi:multidrug efflux pump subunit AcrA (membrane-fusion protein)
MSESEEQRSEPPPSPPPPRGPRLSVILAVLVVGCGALAAGAHWSNELKDAAARAWDYLAALHPQAEEPAGGRRHVAGPAAETSGATQYYTCGMHPLVILPKPGDCPICHMKLVPIDSSKSANEIVINPVMTQNIGVRIAPVEVGPVTGIVRTVGSVDYNETLVRDVSLKVSGWVEKLHANYMGQPVKAGQPLLEIYSPDLCTAQEEYILAYRKVQASKGAPAAGGIFDVGRMDAEMLASARKRLENFDVSPEQIRDLEKRGTAERTMTLRSPFEGLVVVKNVYEGVKVEAGAQLLRIADLSKVWIMVAIYEYQIPFVQTGQRAVMTLPYIPGQTFEGKVAYIYPYLNQELRQEKVRMEFDNPGLFLKPGMFANIELRSTLAADRTLVPREAVIDTGERRVAYVSLGEGRFEPRDVTVGVEVEGGKLEILEGLSRGEMVVVSGQFLLDSEARLREARSKMVRGNLAAEQKAEAVIAGVSEVAALPDAAAKAIGTIADAAFQIGSKLADDSAEGLAAPARQIAEAVDALLKIEMPGDEHFWHRHTEIADVRGKALEVAEAKDLAGARQRFADLSIALSRLLRATGVPPSYGRRVEELHCPMYREGQGGTIWLQPAGDARNPYFGKVMIGCFDSRLTLPMTGAKPATKPPAHSPPAPPAAPAHHQ